MTRCEAGEVVLVEFIFSDESGVKKRPALVISNSAYHRSREEVIMAAITSNTTRAHFGDTPIQDWQKAGLLLPSVVTAIIRTIKSSMIARKLGSLSSSDYTLAGDHLQSSLAFRA